MEGKAGFGVERGECLGWSHSGSAICVPLSDLGRAGESPWTGSKGRTFLSVLLSVHLLAAEQKLELLGTPNHQKKTPVSVQIPSLGAYLCSPGGQASPQVTWSPSCCCPGH